MKNINSPDGDNIGGVLRFNFIDVNDVDIIPDPIEGKIIEVVTLKEGKQWYCGYGTLDTIGYTESSEQTSSGTIYKKQFVASCPQDSADNGSLFEENRHKKFILDYTDSNGLRKLVGTIDEPLFFLSVLNTQTNRVSLAGHSITFYCDSTHKSPQYDV